MAVSGPAPCVCAGCVCLGGRHESHHSFWVFNVYWLHQQSVCAGFQVFGTCGAAGKRLCCSLLADLLPVCAHPVCVYACSPCLQHHVLRPLNTLEYYKLSWGNVP